MKAVFLAPLLAIAVSSVGHAKEKVIRQIASACGGATSFEEAKSVTCTITNNNKNRSEEVVEKSMASAEGETSALILQVGQIFVEASSYSVGACNEGDFIFVSDKKSGTVVSTKSGDISFNAGKNTEFSFSISCKFKR